MSDAPLSGTTVVAVEQAVAAPFASRQLAELGARVIKIERPGDGDFARHYDDSVLGLSSYFVWLNRSKESLQLDLKQVEGRDVLGRLLENADILISNLAPGAMARLGLSPETAHEKYPQLVVCTISGFGRFGEWADRKAYDLIAQGETGVISITGTPESPAKAGLSIADIATGMYAFSGVLAALMVRDQTGVGSMVDISVFDALTEWMGSPMYYTAYGGSPPERTGMAHATIAPYGPFYTSDGVVMIAVQNDREWQMFCKKILADESIAMHERFRTNADRVRNRPELSRVIEQRTNLISTQDLVAFLDEAGIAHGSLNPIEYLFDHPLVKARGLTEIETEAGRIQMTKPPVRFSSFSPSLSRIPAVGEHSVSIVEELGYSEEEIALLRDRDVI